MRHLRCGPTAATSADATTTHSLSAAVAALACILAPAALADRADETALAEKHAPVVRLVEQTEECGPGEPYLPADVDVVLNEPTVALRGPWSATDLVKIAPVALDLVNRFEYHLDYPGNALDPGCDYEKWFRHIKGRSKPTVYAHVATDPGYPGELSLQYWFFYVFNDFNNTHEGDWEMIQLNFHASTAAEALTHGALRGGLQLTRGRRACRVGWRQGRDRRRHPSGRVSGSRLPCQQVHCGAVPRELRRGRASGATTPGARTTSCDPS